METVIVAVMSVKKKQYLYQSRTIMNPNSYRGIWTTRYVGHVGSHLVTSSWYLVYL